MQSATAKLASVSWDFRDARTNEGSHAIHPYPAKFIPQIPRTLIDMFHPGGELAILDPFCGSGTTNAVAFDMGLPSIGIDINPLAALVAKVKTTTIRGSLTAAAREIVFQARKRLATRCFVIPDLPRIDHWFKKPVQEALASIVAELAMLPDRHVADALKVALSRIIVRVSNQDSDTRYAAVEKKVDDESVLKGFERAAASVARALADTGSGLFASRPATRIINKDLMTVTSQDIGCEVGLVITSPPYPNAYEYWLYHKYRMYWLGMDPIAVREAEIGARPHYFKKNHQTEDDFERQMEKCFALLADVMEPGRYACFVVGRSIIHGREIDNEALLTRAARKSGFHNLASVQRSIASTRKSFNLSHGTINREGIVLFVLEEK